MGYLLLAGVLFIALAGMCPGPPKPVVQPKGCRCAYCAWYIHKRNYCSDPYRRPIYRYPRWSFSSPQEMVEAWEGEFTEDLIGRSLALLQEEWERQMLADLVNVKPMGPGPIYFHRHAA